MSNDKSEPESGKSSTNIDLETKLEIDGVGSDYFLRSFVELVNSSTSMKIGITLHVEGCVISGDLVSASAYLAEMEKLFSKNTKGDDAKFWKEWISGFQPSKNAEDDPESSPPLPNYIHLMDARLFHPDGVIPSNEGVLWRGRINAVSGFNFGKLNTESN